MDEIEEPTKEEEPTKSSDNVANIRKQLSRAKDKNEKLEKAIAIALEHLVGDGYPNKEQQAAINSIKAAMKG